MKIITLVENTSISEKFDYEHGLCLYIETDKHKLLFDVGASSLFVENAKKMDVDLSDVDLVVLSHGHYDHGGGIEAFLDLNTKAKIYMNQKSFDKHYSKRATGENVYIGLNRSLLPNDRFVFIEKDWVIDEELELFSGIKGKKFYSRGNQRLLMESGDGVIEDDFAHEQNLLIYEGTKIVLIAGCAHKGIVNILSQMEQEKKKVASHVIGGFHLYNHSANTIEELSLIDDIGNYLIHTPSNYYTCHCTGIVPYNRLREIMNNKIQYLATGSQIVI